MGKIILLFLLIQLAGCNTVPYKEATSEWTSYKDVANWLDKNFYFDKERMGVVQRRLRQQGAMGLLARDPQKLYKSSYGYCVDSANFALDNLNKINQDYNARWVFIWNDLGRPHHWVTAFDFEGKLYVMDYGAGPTWNALNGVHGPFDSLDEYRDLIISLDIPGLDPGEVEFRYMPGTKD